VRIIRLLEGIFSELKLLNENLSAFNKNTRLTIRFANLCLETDENSYTLFDFARQLTHAADRKSPK
jgi:hypothetical protein